MKFSEYKYKMKNQLNLSNKRFLQQIYSLTAPYWRSEEKRIAWFLLTLVIALNYFIVEVAVKYSDWNRDFFNLMQNKEWHNFWPMLGQFILIMAIYSLIDLAEEYFRRTLRIRWRNWLTNVFLNQWLSHKRLYRHQLLYSNSDNPDQRISQDVKEFCDQTLYLGFGLLRTITSLISFTVILWELSGTLHFEFAGISWVIPGYMLWVAILYSVIGTWLTHKITKRLIPLTFEQEKCEADFRFHLMRIKEYAESIVFLRGEKAELARSKKLFSKIWKNWQHLTGMKVKYGAFTSGYNEVARIFPYLVASPRLMTGGLQLGDMMQTATGFYRVQEAFSWFVDSYESVANWRAVTERLITFYTQLESISPTERIHRTTQPSWSGLDIMLPDNKVIQSNMTGSFIQNSTICGPSGCGKSSFLRTIAGLWPHYKGQLSMPCDDSCMFIPQKTYLPKASLREILSYPNIDCHYDDWVLKQALNDVSLKQLIDKLDVIDNWQHKLSGGEIQKLMIARCLVQKPEWLFLDEALSALDHQSYIALSQLLRTKLANSHIIEISHRSGQQFNQMQFTL
ncbi:MULTISPECIES: ABC transporter ATP-binding protein/permease [Xenorhabdus]|nr:MULTISPECIES: ABC transporter ATP-binding protein/permease [Xenorhabdus]